MITMILQMKKEKEMEEKYEPTNLLIRGYKFID